MYLGCSVYNCGGPIPVSMLRVNTRIETQGDRTGGEERLNMPTVVYQHPLMGVVYQHPLMPAAVAAGGSAVAPRMADVYVIDDPGSSAVAAGGSAVAAGGSAVAVDATAVIPSGMVRDRIAALQSAAVVLASLANSGDLEMELDPTDPNSGDLEMELDFADPNSGDWDGELDEDDIFRRQRPHRLILAHHYNTDE